tara:strand:- start:98 stop:235 length:138 start_codon:yes stop_codon:yes gene_type:complete
MRPQPTGTKRKAINTAKNTTKKQSGKKKPATKTAYKPKKGKGKTA